MWCKTGSSHSGKGKRHDESHHDTERHNHRHLRAGERRTKAGRAAGRADDCQIRAVRDQITGVQRLPGACPAPEKSTAWSFTSIPGTVSYMVVRKGGSVSGRFKARP